MEREFLDYLFQRDFLNFDNIIKLYVNKNTDYTSNKLFNKVIEDYKNSNNKESIDDKEKILRWNLQESIKEYNSSMEQYELPLASMIFAVKEQRRKNVDKCTKELNDYLNEKGQTQSK